MVSTPRRLPSFFFSFFLLAFGSSAAPWDTDSGVASGVCSDDGSMGANGYRDGARNSETDALRNLRNTIVHPAAEPGSCAPPYLTYTL